MANKKRELENITSSGGSTRNFKKPRKSSINHTKLNMEDLMLKFPHLSEQNFKKLEDADLAKSREVKRSWKTLIDEKNYSWLRIVNIPTILNKKDTYLHLAARYGQIEAFKIALDEEADINIKDSYGHTPFSAACMYKNYRIVEYLLAKNTSKIDLNSKDKIGYTAFHWACAVGESKIATLIMSNSVRLNIDLNAKNENNDTAFMLACRHGNYNIIECLLIDNTSRIDFNTKDENGLTAFHLTCSAGESSIARLIMSNSARLNINLNDKDNRKKTAFMLACTYGNYNTIECLLEKNTSRIDFNAKDRWRQTAFHSVIRRGDKSIAKLIMSNSARLNINLNAKDEYDLTAFMLACVKGNTSGNYSMVECLLEHNNSRIDFNAKDRWGQTAFLWACNVSDTSIVKLIMSNAARLNINLNAEDDDGNTGFVLACSNGNSAIVEMIRKNSIPLNIELNAKEWLFWPFMRLA